MQISLRREPWEITSSSLLSQGRSNAACAISDIYSLIVFKLSQWEDSATSLYDQVQCFALLPASQLVQESRSFPFTFIGNTYSFTFKAAFYISKDHYHVSWLLFAFPFSLCQIVLITLLWIPVAMHAWSAASAVGHSSSAQLWLSSGLCILM